MKSYESLGFFDFEDFVEELTDEQLFAINGGSCAGGAPSGGHEPTGGGSCGGGYNPSYNPGPSNPPSPPMYGGSCGGGGAVTPSNPYPTPTSACGGGYNFSSQGSFGYITNKNAKNARMQDYVSDPEKDKMNGNMLFSKKGCKMMGFAKILSQITGKTFTIQDINNKYDVGEDGFISKEEVGEGIKKNLAKNKSLIVDYWEKSLTKERLDSITKQAGTTYILGRAENVAGDEHWVVLEGYNTNSSGQIEFTYNPTSINDYGRKFILGEPTPQQKENNYYKIDRIETFTVN